MIRMGRRSLGSASTTQRNTLCGRTATSATAARGTDLRGVDRYLAQWLPGAGREPDR